MIQPAGLGGTPSAGQRCTAATKASCTASSAASMSPRRRTRTATARPYCSRKTPLDLPRRARPVVEPVRRTAGRAAPRSGAWSPGGPPAPLERGVQVRHVDDREAAEVLLALGVRTVGDEHVAVHGAQHGRASGSCRPPANTHAPAACISLRTTSRSAITCRRNSASGAGPPAGASRAGTGPSRSSSGRRRPRAGRSPSVRTGRPGIDRRPGISGRTLCRSHHANGTTPSRRR